MTNPNAVADNRDTEKELKIKLEKWSLIEETAIQQKSRVQWLRTGMQILHIFFAQLKNRVAQNTITSLLTSDGTRIFALEELENEILIFYRELLGKSAAILPSVDATVMQLGHTLNREQQQMLAAEVTVDEIEQALKDISDLKALGQDGFNALFFKKAWQIVGTEITMVVQ
ncbi:hypothetical protein P3L10_007832 [Capsicum annuum]